MTHSEKHYDIKRYDASFDRSLRPHSAADEYLLHHFSELAEKPKQIAIYNDRFGYLCCHLHVYDPIIVLTHQSQKKSIQLNFTANQLQPLPTVYPLLATQEKLDFALIKAPKSLALYDLFLQHACQNATDDVSIVVTFMTRHFSPQLITIAEKYFEDVKQTRAVKKARLITLNKKKPVKKIDPIDVIQYNDQSYQQYWGVFSADHIDYATQFFIEHLQLKPTDNKIMDLASGNGVIGKEIKNQLPNAEMHLVDDFYLAVESAKLNLEGENVHHHFANDLSNFDDDVFDLIVTNPPFHIEYEISIHISLQLFKECFRCLKPDGNLQLVANKHLNYRTHLKSIFSSVEVVNQNDKFVIYKCVKAGT